MKIRSIAVSKTKGTRKKPIEQVLLVTEHGVQGDAHAGVWHRRVSFLAIESIEKAKAAAAALAAVANGITPVQHDIFEPGGMQVPRLCSDSRISSASVPLCSQVQSRYLDGPAMIAGREKLREFIDIYPNCLARCINRWNLICFFTFRLNVPDYLPVFF